MRMDGSFDDIDQLLEQGLTESNDWWWPSSCDHFRDLVPAGYVDYSTRAAILNAAYFKVFLKDEK